MSSRWSLSTSFFQNRHALSQQQLITTFTEDEVSYLKTLSIQSYLPGSLCWVEKFLLLIDFLQIFGILWNAAQPWPWPYQWVYVTKSLNYVNLDYFSQTNSGALLGRTNTSFISRWGQMDGYMYYALAFAIVMAFIMALVAMLAKPTERYARNNFPFRTHILAALGVIIYFGFCPTLLAVLRLFYCETVNGVYVLAVDPNVECISAGHIAVTIVAGLLILPMVFGLPYVLYSYVEKNRIYHDEHDHEKRIQVWELLYMLQLDQYWLDNHVWLLASFRRYGSFYYLHMTILKFVLIVVFIAVRASMVAQSSTMVIILCCYATYYLLLHRSPPFRSISTNIIFGCLIALWLLQIFFGLANAAHARNAVTVASTAATFLISTHLAAFIIIVCVFLYDSIVRTTLDWPSVRTLERITHHRDLLPKVALWIESYREAQHILHDFLLAPAEVADIQALEACIRRMRHCWLQARSMGSIFETALTELLEHLLHVHSTRYLFALRKHDHWDRAYQENVVAGTFTKRQDFAYLMNPRKRKLLSKLFAYRAMRGDHLTSGKFNLATAQEYERSLHFQEELRRRKNQRRASVASTSSQKSDDSSARRKSTFSLFQKNAADFFATHAANLTPTAAAARLKKMQSIVEDEDDQIGKGSDDEDSKSDQHLTKDDQDKEADEEGETSDEEDRYDENGILKKTFPPEFVHEAAKMIARLQERTELALNKHHEASKSHYEQQRLLLLHQQKHGGGSGSNPSSSSSALNVLKPAGSFTGSASASFFNSALHLPGLTKIGTMELMKRTADEDEIRDLEDLFHLWDEAILLYEQEEFPGDYQALNVQTEAWYTYRGLVSQRLELIVNMINEQEELLENLADEHVEEEGLDDDDEDDASENVSAYRSQSDQAAWSRQRSPLAHDDDDGDQEHDEEDGLLTAEERNRYRIRR